MAQNSADIKRRLKALNASISRVEYIIKEHMEAGESMSDLASKMPTLMDRAKLNVFVSYALLSLVHSTLRVSDPHSVAQPPGTPSHPVRTELERIKHYFEKIEQGGSKPHEARKTKVDAAAADRFIKSAIATAPKHTRFDDDTPPEPKRKKQM